MVEFGLARQTWNTKLSQRIVDWRKTPRFLQAPEEDVNLEELCQEFLALDSSIDGLDCACTTLENGNVDYNCTDKSCPLCNDDAAEICGFPSYSIQLGADADALDYVVAETFLFEYAKGLEGTVALSFDGCDFSDPDVLDCAQCNAFVNDELCSSCSICDDGYSITVGCENLVSNSSFVCEIDAPSYGIFQGLGFYFCDYGPPKNGACADSTMLSLNEAIFGTTSGASGQILVSDCGTFDDALQAVWYSVVGTGGMMMASTCSSETYIDTSFEIYSGSCDSLLCVKYMESPCGGLYNGGRPNGGRMEKFCCATTQGVLDALSL